MPTPNAAVPAVPVGRYPRQMIPDAGGAVCLMPPLSLGLYGGSEVEILVEEYLAAGYTVVPVLVPPEIEGFAPSLALTALPAGYGASPPPVAPFVISLPPALARAASEVLEAWRDRNPDDVTPAQDAALAALGGGASVVEVRLTERHRRAIQRAFNALGRDLTPDEAAASEAVG